jgi:CobQ-like glutamine amidotransferase family enzyme
MYLRICHLYPDLMNIYGDRGNIFCLVKRCQWRGIKVAVKEISVGDKINPRRFDFYFAGGGQDRQQIAVSADLQGDKKKVLKEAVEMGVPMLTICGSYQLFGHYFKPFEGPKLPGISIFDAYTVASKKRKIGNIVVQLSANSYQLTANTLVGFENHSGNTYISKVNPFDKSSTSSNPESIEGLRVDAEQSRSIKSQKSKVKTYPLGKVLIGFGNNGQDKTEGAVYKNVFGCYLHGPFLPKNPHFADYLISLSLKRRYGEIKLKPLEDNLEWQAHQFAIKRARQTR